MADPKKQKTEGQSVLDEARAAAVRSRQDYMVDYWPSDEDLVQHAPAYEEDGKPRLYWAVEEGSVCCGYYLGTIIVNMLNYKKDAREDRAFAVFEVKAPPGYKSQKPFGVRATRPGAKKGEYEIVSEGEIVYVGLRSQLQRLVFCSAFDFQPIVALRASEKTRTASNNNLWMFDFLYWSSDRQPLRKLAASGNIGAMFKLRDQGYEAAKLLKLAIPPGVFAAFEEQFALNSGQEHLALPLSEPDKKALPANGSAST